VAITDESICVSQLLGARAGLPPPKPTPMNTFIHTHAGIMYKQRQKHNTEHVT